MRIHTDTITREDIAAATPDSVTTYEITDHGSRKRDHAFLVKLSGTASRNTYDNTCKGATWDEWGMFIAALYEVDSTAIIGDYRHADHFHYATGYRFAEGAPARPCPRHKWAFTGESATGACIVHTCEKCNAVRRHVSDFEAVFSD